ncbi:GNAT family N-acetyltransferase [Paenibacillus allorhizosphaerae]|uniref:N-acetyltransferase domain-containing protein n=1 Tax=Paenibacillus allorhizosphaerae TaxID=2849866 RepID=A0ABN7TPB8_9BACL|nr:GNAT family N-acetyltransferase [Paenibacillus allorhizosphaerae]CAG7644413.1 hypothetical protein PAECIP111802_03258 [Paenibacillus allorhizosphaerae]
MLGFWSPRYIPYSYADNGHVIANVSVNILDCIMDGNRPQAMQIGTVMTHPDYRNRGLSSDLMNIVLAKYEEQCDFIYLFANRDVLDYYPKFGFQAMQESLFYMDRSPESPQSSDAFIDKGIRKLNGKNSEDLRFIYKFASARRPVSRIFGTEHTLGILMYYCLNVFYNDIYYLEREDVIVLYKQEPSRIDMFDIISRTEINLERILNTISRANTAKIVFHYTPDDHATRMESSPYAESDVLFVRSRDPISFPARMKHPSTSQA